jgi:TM2 domain-containing membrane protein YozV
MASSIEQPVYPDMAQPTPRQPIVMLPRKRPWLAALLGLLIVGVGHVYLGEWGKGIGLLVVGVILSLLTGGLLAPVMWIISCVWAYTDAKAYNRKAGYAE